MMASVMNSPSDAAVIRIGVLTPHVTPGPDVEFAAMAPGRVVTRVARVMSPAGTGGDGEPSSVAALHMLTAPSYLERAAEQLLVDPVDMIGYASTTSSYVIGFDAELAMLSCLSRLTGLPVASTCASALRALRVLEVTRVALVGAPWFDPEYNRLGAAYFAGQGLDVVCSESAQLWQDPEPAAVCEWTSRHVDDAEAVFIGGNGFRVAGAIAAVEATIERPVLTANQVLLWQLLGHAAGRLELDGYGQLFTHSP
jgi:maleate isomerase